MLSIVQVGQSVTKKSQDQGDVSGCA